MADLDPTEKLDDEEGSGEKEEKTGGSKGKKNEEKKESPVEKGKEKVDKAKETVEKAKKAKEKIEKAKKTADKVKKAKKAADTTKKAVKATKTAVKTAQTAAHLTTAAATTGTTGLAAFTTVSAAAGASSMGISLAVEAAVILHIIYVVAIIIAVIIAIMTLIGDIAFFLTVPGLVMGKLKALIQSAVDWVESLYKSQAEAYTNEEDIIEIANYLQSMGYDLIGYGFVDAKTEDIYKDLKTSTDLEADGYELNDEGKYSKNGSTYTENYIGADGYVYDGTTGNKLIDTEGGYIDKYGIRYNTYGANTTDTSDDEEKSGGAVGTFETMGDIIGFASEEQYDILRTYAVGGARLYYLKNDDLGILHKIYRGIENIKSPNPFQNTGWSNGLIKLYVSDSNNPRIASEVYSWLEAGSAEVNTATKELTIKDGWFNMPMKFKMDGWSGRYGTPLEFLLSLHIATMSPELVTTIARNFDTEVQVYLNEQKDLTVSSLYKVDNDYVILTQNMADLNSELAYKGENINVNLISKKEAKQIMGWMQLKSITADDVSANEGLKPYLCLGIGEIVPAEKSDGDYIEKEHGGNVTISSPTKFSFENAVTEGGHGKDCKKDEYGNYTCSIDLAHIGRWIVNDGGAAIEGAIDVIWGALQGNYEGMTKEVLNDLYKNTSMGSEMQKNYKKDKDKLITAEENAIKTTYAQFMKEYAAEQLGTDASKIQIIYLGEDKELSEANLKTELNNLNDIEEKVELSFEALSTTDTIDSDEATQSVDFSIVVELEFDHSIGECYWRYLNTIQTIEYTESPDSITLCSDSKSDTCCSNCQKYVKKIIKAMKRVADGDFKMYKPFIARVVNSWFRDTYFVLPNESDAANDAAIQSAVEDFEQYDDTSDLAYKNVNTIQNDAEYEYQTNELWTDYITVTEGGTTVIAEDGKPEYRLYLIDSAGNFVTDVSKVLTNSGKLSELSELTQYYSNTEDDDNHYYWLSNTELKKNNIEKDGEKVAREYDIKLIKKAKINEKTGSSWSAYENSTGKIDTEPEKLEINENSPEILKLMQEQGLDNFYYEVDGEGNELKQKKDGLRGETNPKIKYLFRNKKYYTFDGTQLKAEEIYKDWEYCINNTSELSSSEIQFKSDEFEKFKEQYKKANTAYKWISNSVQLGVDIAAMLFGNPVLAIAGFVNSIDQINDILSIDQDIENTEPFIVEAFLNNEIDKYYIKGKNSLKFTREIYLDEQGNYTFSNPDPTGKQEPVYVLKSDSNGGDPRNPDLIGNISIEKSSLSAFSMLEATNSADADYVYRDMKELMVELNYFDKEDLAENPDDVLTWIMPEYEHEWPIEGIDKIEDEYGIIINSKKALINVIKDIEDEIELLEETNALIKVNNTENTDEKVKDNETKIEQLKEQIDILKGKGKKEDQADSSDSVDTTDTSTHESSTTDDEIAIGYDNDLNIYSPATASVKGYGTYNRINKYAKKIESEEVAALEEETEFVDTTSLGEEKVGYIMLQIHSLSELNELFAKVPGYKPFYEDEYKGVCEDYIITIDGFEPLASDEDEYYSYLQAHEADEEVSCYQENEVPKLYDDAQEEKLKEREKEKFEAEKFYKGKVQYKSEEKDGTITVKESDKIFIKEGTIIGTAKNDENSYIRILIKKYDGKQIENIEEYFSLPDYESGEDLTLSACGASEQYLAWHIMTFGQMAVPACGIWCTNYGDVINGERYEYTNDDTGYVPNLMPELAMIPGSQNVQHLTELGYDPNKLTSFSYIGKSGKNPVKLDHVVDTYYLYINSAIEDIKSKVNRELKQHELDALVETYIWGQDYAHQLCKKINANGTLTESDFHNLSGLYATITYDRQTIAYNIFSKGIYLNPDNLSEKATFKTETPFSDMVFKEAERKDVFIWGRE